MGKHKSKSKKHKHEKKKKHRKRKHSSSSDSGSSDEWVEKTKSSSESENDDPKISKPSLPSNSNKPTQERDEWMNFNTGFKTTSNAKRKEERDNQKREEREKQIYNPRECTRELNPYWKDGGDGLPKFKKPSDDLNYNQPTSSTAMKPRTSNWKKPKTESNPPTTPHKSEPQPESNPPTTPHESEPQPESSEPLSQKELNILAAKLVKAEIMGNTKLINELKAKLEQARNTASGSSLEEDVILTHTDSKGQTQPVRFKSDYGDSRRKEKKKKTETHQDGQRVRYFADDDKYSLQEMFQKEKYNTAEDQNREFMNMSSKVRRNDDLDDVFTDNIRKKESEAKMDSRNRDKAIGEHQRVTASLDNCSECIQSDLMQKHLMISMGETVYLSLPSYEPLTEGHCLIVPIRHVPCATLLDENEWAEVLDFRKALVKLFLSKDEDVVFFETAMSLHKFPHMAIQCIPVPKEQGDLAPIYFKKAIDESETEWAQNKKLVSLKGRDVRRAIPKGLPYFSVSFGMEEGYAHVIEDEMLFPKNFAQEIIGGMLDAHHSKWRKPKRQSFEEQSKRSLSFSKEWSQFDCTVK